MTEGDAVVRFYLMLEEAGIPARFDVTPHAELRPFKKDGDEYTVIKGRQWDSARRANEGAEFALASSRMKTLSGGSLS